MFSNWPRSEEKREKTDEERRERSGMAELVSAWLRVCAHKRLCTQPPLHGYVMIHTVLLCTGLTYHKHLPPPTAPSDKGLGFWVRVCALSRLKSLILLVNSFTNEVLDVYLLPQNYNSFFYFVRLL